MRKAAELRGERGKGVPPTSGARRSHSGVKAWAALEVVALGVNPAVGAAAGDVMALAHCHTEPVLGKQGGTAEPSDAAANHDDIRLVGIVSAAVAASWGLLPLSLCGAATRSGRHHGGTVPDAAATQ